MKITTKKIPLPFEMVLEWPEKEYKMTYSWEKLIKFVENGGIARVKYNFCHSSSIITQFSQKDIIVETLCIRPYSYIRLCQCEIGTGPNLSGEEEIQHGNGTGH